MALRQVFVTVGTTKFDQLVNTITKAEVLEVLRVRGCEKLIIQIGRGEEPDTRSAKPTVEFFKYRSNIVEIMRESDLVISHAGAGTCLEAMDAGRNLLVVINEDLMDNHQKEVAEKLSEMGHLYYTDCSKLRHTLHTADFSKLKPYDKGDPKVFTRFIDNMMGLEKVN